MSETGLQAAGYLRGEQVTGWIETRYAPGRRDLVTVPIFTEHGHCTVDEIRVRRDGADLLVSVPFPLPKTVHDGDGFRLAVTVA